MTNVARSDFPVTRRTPAPMSILVVDDDLKRLETIAALAVRMRETVRLSQACEARAEQARSL